MKIAICDDEPLMCRSLEEKIAAYMEKSAVPFQVACYPDGESLPLQGYDILFLDIQMPGISGMELAKRLRAAGSSCAILFVTVLREGVFDAFEVDAVDYLCKPIDDIRLGHSLDRAMARIRERNSSSLLIQIAGRWQTVRLDSILYCEVLNRKVSIHTRQRVIEYYSRLSDVERQLDQRFVKCHRSYLVNLDYLAQCTREQITLANGEHLPVSKARWQGLMDHMLHYMKNEVEQWPQPPQT